MPIKPGQSPITLVNVTTSPVFNVSARIGGLNRRDFSEPYERDEWKGDRERSVLNPDGSKPVISEFSGGRLIQYLNSCNTNDRARYFGTDTSRLDNIYLRWDIREWDYVGDPSLSASTDQIAALARSHAALLAKFENHKNQAKSGNIDYDTLVGMRSENFSYLTSTNFSMSGNALGSETGITNCLITNFQRDVSVESPGLGVLLYEFRLTVQVRTLTPASATSF